MPNRFWVFDWLDTMEIESYADIQLRLNAQESFDEFVAAARDIGSAPVPKNEGLITLLAGRGIALTGRGACATPACVKKQVDDLLKHVWHYFDRIIVDDLTLYISETENPDRIYIGGWLWALLYLKQIGADSLIEFSDPKFFCVECAMTHADADGLLPDEHTIAEIATHILHDAQLDVIDRGDTPGMKRVYISSPGLQGASGTLKPEAWVSSHTRGEMLAIRSEEVARKVLSEIFSDLATASAAGAPLGMTAAPNRFALSRLNTTSQDQEATAIAFDIRLPVLDNVPVKELVAIRNQHGDVFKNFQFKLRQAIHERIKASGGEAPQHIAREIVEDIIDPGIAEIRVAFNAGQARLARSHRNIGLGVALSTVGAAFLPSSPLVGAVAGGIGAITAAAGAVSANATTALDNLETHNMYFLFEAARHAEEDPKFR